MYSVSQRELGDLRSAPKPVQPRMPRACFASDGSALTQAEQRKSSPSPVAINNVSTLYELRHNSTGLASRGFCALNRGRNLFLRCPCVPHVRYVPNLGISSSVDQLHTVSLPDPIMRTYLLWDLCTVCGDARGCHLENSEPRSEQQQQYFRLAGSANTKHARKPSAPLQHVNRRFQTIYRIY